MKGLCLSALIGLGAAACGKPAPERVIPSRTVQVPPKIPTGRVGHFETTRDLGPVQPRTTVSHEFVFRNLGPGSLRLAGVRTCCGCTARIVSDRELPAGAEGRIRVECDVPDMEGSFRRTVYLASSDPDTAHVALTVAGVVVPHVRWEPAELSLGTVPAGTRARACVVVEAVSGAGVEAVEAAAPGTPWGVETVPLPARAAWRIDLTAPETLDPGPIRGHVVVQARFRDGRARAASIPVKGLVTRLAATPASVDFGSVALGKGATRDVEIVLGADVLPERVAVYASTRRCRVELLDQPRPDSPGRLRITVDPASCPGSFEAKAWIHALDAHGNRSESTVIPIRGVVEADYEVLKTELFLGVRRAGSDVATVWLPYRSHGRPLPPPVRVLGTRDVVASWWRQEFKLILRLDWTPGRRPGRVVGRLAIGDPGCQFHVPFHGYVSPTRTGGES